MNFLTHRNDHTKASLATELAALSSPFLRRCGYDGASSLVYVFDHPVDTGGCYTLDRIFGVAHGGVITAVDGGQLEVALFTDLPIDDLLKLRRLLVRMPSGR